jgi:methylated-DNA-[protein]-cysteine S-methyltransferase
MNWKVIELSEDKKSAILSSPNGEWVATWGRSGLFGLKRNESVPTEHLRAEVPDWLATAWDHFWEGKAFDGRLCLERQPSVMTAAVWRIVLDIPFGKTLTYGEVAAKAGSPHGARAVGSIMRANPWALFLPCHRVIGADGRMRGYGGPSGIGLKARLIDYEKRIVAKG